MLLREPHNAAVRELLDPMGRLPHPILDGNGEARASSIIIEHIPFRTFFSRKGGVVVDKACLEEFEFFSLSVSFPRPLFTVLSMFALALLEGADEAACDISDSVKVVRDRDSGCGCVRRVDRA
jgi:hypothetical protein